MPAPTHAPALPAGAPGRHMPEIDLETRLALTDASMTLRLEQALTRLAVDTAHAETAAPQAVNPEAVAAYAASVRPAPDLYPTPVAALLQRAAARLAAGGWCRGATVAQDGARCLYGAIRAEDPGGRHSDDALAVLLEAIRRQWPGAATIPRANDELLPDGRAAVRILGDAATLADTRGQ